MMGIIIFFYRMVSLDVVSLDILNRNEESAAMQDQSRKNTASFLDWFGSFGE
jgi:hypothetical protein